MGPFWVHRVHRVHAQRMGYSTRISQADEVLLELRPSSSVLDLQLLAQLEERLRRCHHWMTGAIKNRLVDR